MTTRPTPPHSGSAPDIVSKIREALELSRNHAAFADARYNPDVQHKCNEALALLPQLEKLLAKEPVPLEKIAKALQHCDQQDGMYPCTWDNLNKHIKRSYLDKAKAALTAAGVSYAE